MRGMRKYTRRAQVLFTEAQYRDLLEVAAHERKPVGTLLREAAERAVLRRKRAREKAQAVKELLSLAPTAVPPVIPTRRAGPPSWPPGLQRPPAQREANDAPFPK